MWIRIDTLVASIKRLSGAPYHPLSPELPQQAQEEGRLARSNLRNDLNQQDFQVRKLQDFQVRKPTRVNYSCAQPLVLMSLASQPT